MFENPCRVELMDMHDGVVNSFSAEERVYRGREEYAQYFLKKKGFDAFQCRVSSLKGDLSVHGYEEVVDEIKSMVSESVGFKELLRTGCPDLFAVSGCSFMFVEVKSFDDGLRHTQVKWLSRYGSDLPVKILFVE